MSTPKKPQTLYVLRCTGVGKHKREALFSGPYETRAQAEEVAHEADAYFTIENRLPAEVKQ